MRPRDSASDCSMEPRSSQPPSTSTSTSLRTPNSTKAYGQAVHYGRKIMYKSCNGKHAVLMTPIVNDSGNAPNSTSPEAFPRLGDALDIIDDLYTHLYSDGFIPLIRANAHAAIPLRRGRGMLAELFTEQGPSA